MAIHDDTTMQTELALREQVRELRAALARIRGAAEFSTGAAENTLDAYAFARIAEQARAALAGEEIAEAPVRNEQGRAELRGRVYCPPSCRAQHR